MKKILFVFLMVLSGSGIAVSSEDLGHGSDGLTEVPLDIANAGEEAMACKVSLAHWFSEEVGRAAPGEQVFGALWSDSDSGTVYYLNGSGDRMPVERFWCGPAGRTWKNRFEISLDRKAGKMVEPIQLKCSETKTGFSCVAG
ncbi:hypothetical protein [Roseibium aggregatum]|uniref:Ig-like domain-containing protein n=1 Tax=Roseibium aggregatum TaxID=187304 RepID=A0A939ELS7_9HYPH|nr:hypothetical protein [Roseibium aggregatum]MBN9673900.1 hypothetical protein [Roseibium aggregatum]